MTVGSIILILIGILYLIWSYNSIKDIFFNKSFEDPNPLSVVWIISISTVLMLFLISLLTHFWNYELF